MPSELESLTASIVEARATLTAIRIVGPRYFLLTALAGYLWNAIAGADTLLAVVQSGAGRGAGPLKRLLHDSYLDALFLASDTDADLLAAKSFLSDYRDSRTLLSDYRRVLSDHPDSNLPAVPPSWTFFDRPVEEVIQTLDFQNAAHGGTRDLFARAWASWEASRHWHWSGCSRKKMVEILIERGRLDGRSAFIALSLTKMYNAAAHAGAPWAELPPTDDGSTAPPPPRSSDLELNQLSLSGRQFLDGTSREVKAYFDALNAG